ncbi:MAG: hypothetical protein IAE78_31030 [Myxococcus sp.]|nr:hypothetical protein [Myxococcus sp.]
MRKLLLGSLLSVFSGCGAGVSPELYAVVVDFFTLPDSCYLNNAQPSNVRVTDAPSLLNIQVWDGPDNTALLELESGLRTIDMGDAPTVTLTGLMKGTRGTGTWNFSSETVLKSTQVGRTLTDTTRFELNFERGQTFKGTGALSSSRACSGSTCTGTQPSCSVGGVNISGTRLQVTYERAP